MLKQVGGNFLLSHVNLNVDHGIIAVESEYIAQAHFALYFVHEYFGRHCKFELLNCY